MMNWTDISNFGDVTITTLIATAIAAWLFVEDEKRLAFWWTALYAAGMGVVVATKMAFIGWGIGIPALDFAGFSGHAMRAAAVLPVLMYLIFQRARFPVRAAGVLTGFAFALLIGVSRVVLHTHSVSEVVAGLLLGTGVGLAFIRIAHTLLSRHVFKPLRILLSALALLPAPYVHPSPTQQWLTNLTLYVSGHENPYPRSDWRIERARRPDAPAP